MSQLRFSDSQKNALTLAGDEELDRSESIGREMERAIQRWEDDGGAIPSDLSHDE